MGPMAKIQGSSSKARARALTTVKAVKAPTIKKASNFRKLTPASVTVSGARQSAANSSLPKKTPVVLWDEMGGHRQFGHGRR
jgi:hypothetical protein